MKRRLREAFFIALDPSSRRDVAFTVVITLLAAAIRLFVVAHFAGEPVWDGHYYHFGASRLADGLGYSEDVVRHGTWVWKPWTHYPVGYSLWLSLWYRLFGAHLWVAPLSNAVVGALTVLCVHRVALRALGLWRARLAALVTTLHPGLVLYTAVTMSEPLAAGLLIASLWPLASAKHRRLGLALSGLMLGASVLVRPSSLLALPLYFLMLDGTLRQRLLSLVMVTVVCFATILPWTLRNCYRMDGCALVSTNAGWNLAIGALTDTGRFRPLHAADGCPVVTGQVQQDRCWMSRGYSEIRRDPWRWCKLAPKKLAQTFDHESFAVEYLREANPKAWPESRRVAWREHLTDAHRWLVTIAAFAAVSLVVGRQCYRSVAFYVQLVLLFGLGWLAYRVAMHDEHPFYWLVLALVGLTMLPLPGRPHLGGLVGFCVGFVGLTAVTHVLFFGDDRYHMVVSPLLGILAGAALRVMPLKARNQHLDPRRSELESVPNSGLRSS
jgi:4-amino-4-deoxy-L-arabinose transferase-like glycosyltransferase